MDPFRTKAAREQFDRFASAHTRELLRTATLLTWDHGEAEEIVQECLLRIARHWPRVARLEHREAYVRRVIVNLALDGRLRRRRRLHELQASEAPEQLPDRRGSGETHLELVGAREELIGAIGALPLRQRTVLVLRFFEDLSEAQTAELLGCSVGTVKSTTSRGLERLRETLAAPQTPDASIQTTRRAQR